MTREVQELIRRGTHTVAEFNLSEITFPYNVQEDAYSVRIFTPGAELPFAGHVRLYSHIVVSCARH